METEQDFYKEFDRGIVRIGPIYYAGACLGIQRKLDKLEIPDESRILVLGDDSCCDVRDFLKSGDYRRDDDIVKDDVKSWLSKSKLELAIIPACEPEGLHEITAEGRSGSIFIPRIDYDALHGKKKEPGYSGKWGMAIIGPPYDYTKGYGGSIDAVGDYLKMWESVRKLIDRQDLDSVDEIFQKNLSQVLG